jgi:hypothetical protein
MAQTLCRSRLSLPISYGPIEFASAPLVKHVGQREERPTKFFLMGLHRHLAQGTLDSL